MIALTKNESLFIESIESFLRMETSGALMITGAWGCGKTYFIKNKLFPYLTEINESQTFSPIIVSLFGIRCKNDLPQRIFSAFIDNKAGSSGKYSKAFDTLQKGVAAVPLIQKFVDTDKLFSNFDIFIKLLSKDTLICFDDFERKSKDISSDDLFGFINELVENNGFKVIIIANDKVVEDLKFKEKVVEKTLTFKSSIPELFYEFIKAKNSEAFTKYIGESNVVKTCLELATKEDPDSSSPSLRREFSNLRTLKFIINNFYEVFEGIVGTTKELDRLTTIKLDNLWNFIFAISNEVKLNVLSDNDKKGLDNNYTYIEDFGLDFSPSKRLIETTDKTITKEEEPYLPKFKSTYYRKTKQEYIFYPELFDFIVSGNPINFNSFKLELDKSFHVKASIIKPCYEILNDFMNKGIWTFKNNEIPEKLRFILDAASKGEFDDYQSYLNAASYITSNSGVINLTDQEVILKMKEGLNIFKDRSEENNISRYNHINSSPIMTRLMEYIEQIISEKKEEDKKKYIEHLNDVLITDIKQFVTEFLLQRDGNISDYWTIPILHELNLQVVKNRMSNLEPEEVYLIDNLIDERYLNIKGIDLTTEIPFVKCINEGISEMNLQEDIFSHLLIKKWLLPKTIRAIKTLERIKE